MKDTHGHFQYKECQTTEGALTHLLKNDCLPIAVIDNSGYVELIHVNNMAYDPFKVFQDALMNFRENDKSLPYSNYNYAEEVIRMGKDNSSYLF
ncbi:hypothetical protein [Rufibacter sp. XAAS-G3-1]|uniref:hypothetical protein n=1 Tax=Rufibacter sp. XAAS-G3-1 TaxID=2729134 RepID=UPI0015E6E4E9|nr:hypothetical protein [Rufibacter sp. XAAS-G3-1]